MNVADIIATDRISLTTDIHSKKRALQRLAALLAEGVPYLTAGEIFNQLIRREKIGSTAIGHGVAVPHARIQGLDDCVGAMLRLSHPIGFDADDGLPVDLIFGLIVPESCDERHAKLLYSLTALLAAKHCRTALRHAEDSKTLATLLIDQVDTRARHG